MLLSRLQRFFLWNYLAHQASLSKFVVEHILRIPSLHLTSHLLYIWLNFPSTRIWDIRSWVEVSFTLAVSDDVHFSINGDIITLVPYSYPIHSITADSYSFALIRRISLVQVGGLSVDEGWCQDCMGSTDSLVTLYGPNSPQRRTVSLLFLFLEFD